MATPLIWRAQRDEFSAVADLEAAAFGAAGWGRAAILESCKTQHVEALLVGETCAAPAGFALVCAVADIVEILTLGVDPAQRRQGLAQGLLSQIIANASQKGASRIFLEVEVGNLAADALYRRAGFTEIDRRPRYFKNGADAVVMRYLLKSDSVG